MRQVTYLSAYNIMWIMVLFDLPVGTSEEKRAYTQFRNFLLDQSFTMAQYSVYLRRVASRDKAKPVVNRIKKNVPPEGRVDILQFTDKQYGDIISVKGKNRIDTRENPDQFVLF